MCNRKKLFFGGLITILLGGGLIGCMGHHNKTPEEKISYVAEKVTKKLDLNETQIINLKSLTDELITAAKEAKAHKQGTHQELEALFSQPTLNQTRLQELVQEKTSRINDAAPNIIAAFAVFYDSLNAEQQAILLEKLKKCKDDHRGWGHH